MDKKSFVRMIGNEFFCHCSDADLKKVLDQVARRGGPIFCKFIKAQSNAAANKEVGDDL